jgi:hypothetical protein
VNVAVSRVVTGPFRILCCLVGRGWTERRGASPKGFAKVSRTTPKGLALFSLLIIPHKIRKVEGNKTNKQQNKMTRAESSTSRNSMIASAGNKKQLLLNKFLSSK